MANKVDTATSNWGTIAEGSMCSFLEPPTHPSYKFYIKPVYGNKFCLSLNAIDDNAWLDDECKEKARTILKEWKTPPIRSKAVQDWIKEVMTYYEGTEMGLSHVRKYYPGFKNDRT